MYSASISVFNLVTPLLLVSSDLKMHASLRASYQCLFPCCVTAHHSRDSDVRWIPDMQGQLSMHLHCFFCFLTLCLILRMVLDRPTDHSLSGLSVLCLFEICTEFSCFPKPLVCFTVGSLTPSSLHRG